VTDARPAAVRVVNAAFWANTYIVPSAEPGGCFLIDPGLDQAAIEVALDAARKTPLAIFCTHGHFDHVGSAEYFREAYGVEVYLHGADLKVASSANFMMMAFGLDARIRPPRVTAVAEDAVVWSRGRDHVELVHTPGHTPGSAVIMVNGEAYTGDTVYRDDTWLTSLPDQDARALRDSIGRLWTTMPDSMTVHPGHGASSTFGVIKETNEPLRRFLGLDRSRP
jgi:hydroxyacylglutathione hydrolase